MTAPVFASKADVVCALMRQMIISGEVQAGDALRQRDIGARFGVSQTPVREALKRLESEGLVTIDPHRGAVVSKSSVGVQREHGDIRAALEALGAKFAAAVITEEQIAELRALNAVMADMSDDDPRYAEANRAFHFKVYECAESPILLSIMRLLWQSILLGPMTARRHGESWQQHERLIDALEARDGELAARLMSEHILGSGSD
ncbi:GntR family transcriptional regulator [Mycobacterium sp. NAZ190054]|uniref:GntR family transcriptional regulator n=1 Tax=Mycobacterium sp. NAZ190054 TaxID=1747766 RepID=UPI0018D25524|nr:GntR family transcriptional regulator [Mycobacterium sp. NAZ190054]